MADRKPSLGTLGRGRFLVMLKLFARLEQLAIERANFGRSIGATLL